jgi:hypothetical protein
MPPRARAIHSPEYNELMEGMINLARDKKRDQVVTACLELADAILCGMLEKAGAEDKERKVGQLVEELHKINGSFAKPESLN